MFPIGEGHIADMIARMKNNQALLKRASFFKNHPESAKFRHNKIVSDSKINEKELEKIKIKTIKEKQSEQIKSILILIVIIVVVGWITAKVFFGIRFY
jgi:hypothetical protein